MTNRKLFIPTVLGVIVASAGTFLLMTRRITDLEAEMNAIRAEVQPIHTRCEVLDRDLTATRVDISAIQEAYGELSGAVAGHSEALAKEGRRSRENRSLVDDLRQTVLSHDSEQQTKLQNGLERLQQLEESVSDLADRMPALTPGSAGLPEGVILPWLPHEGGLPPGWLICDGSRGTPDLRARFLRGAGQAGLAGMYVQAAKMQVAGVHSHSTDPRRGMENIPVTDPPMTTAVGEGRVLSDLGIRQANGDSSASHGAHVHEDQHIPEHFTVLFIMKAHE